MAYTRGPRSSLDINVYMFDLSTCEEFQLTYNTTAVTAFIRGDEVLWSDNRDEAYAPDPYHCLDLYSYDLSNWAETQLTDHPYCEWRPETNGRYSMYERDTTEDWQGPRENLLWDRQEGTEIQIVTPGAMAGYYDITDQYAAWSGYTELVDSLGKDVFYFDLASGEETHVPNSADYYCYDVRLWGEYLTYVCSEYWKERPFHLFLHHIPTGEELHLDGEDHQTTNIFVGVIHDNLVAWNTTKHMGTVGAFEWSSDIELYDINTGIYRRLTSSASTLAAWMMYPPYLLMMRPLSDYVYEYYVADLVELGVITADGSLIPGDGLIAPAD